MKLTKKIIDQAKYNGDGKSRDVCWDSSFPGFGVRIYPSGRKSFVLSYRVEGRKRLIVIGVYGAWTLDQAQKRAREFLVDLQKDSDPLEEKQKKSRGETVKDLCRAYLDNYAKEKKITWKKDESRLNRRIIPKWGALKASSIKHSDVAS